MKSTTLLNFVNFCQISLWLMNPCELPEEDSFPEKNGILWTCRRVNDNFAFVDNVKIILFLIITSRKNFSNTYIYDVSLMMELNTIGKYFWKNV